MGTWELILLLSMVISLGLLLILNIPGNFLLVFHAFWYGEVTGFNKYGWNFILTLLLVAAIVELVEYLILAFGKKSYSANKVLVVAVVAGGILGAVIGLFLSPVVDSIIGGIAGAVIGTVIFELILQKKNLKEVKNALIGLLLGRMGTLTVKTMGTVAMAIMIAYKVF